MLIVVVEVGVWVLHACHDVIFKVSVPFLGKIIKTIDVRSVSALAQQKMNGKHPNSAIF